MQWLNYHHLLYFWTVARAGGVTQAAKELGLAQPTISAQLRSLEDALGSRLFQRVGRRLELTEAGRLVYRYASEIFSLGAEMVQSLDESTSDRRARLRIGVADVLPKMLVTRVLKPSMTAGEDVHLICFEGKPSELLARLMTHEIDVVLSDAPVGPEVGVKAFNHQMGESAISIFAPVQQAARYRKDFPHRLDGAPFALPTENTSVRRMLDFWFSRNGVRPRIVAEFEDSALLKAFAERSSTLFAAPSIIAKSIRAHYHAAEVGEAEGVRERFYAISLERRVRNPVVLHLLEAAQEHIFID